MQYVKILEEEIPALIQGKESDRDWDGRQVRIITFKPEAEMTYERIKTLFADGVCWSTILETEGVPDDHGELVNLREEFDHSDFNMAGPITDYRDGSFSVKMGKMTELEEAYELLYGGI